MQRYRFGKDYFNLDMKGEAGKIRRICNKNTSQKIVLENIFKSCNIQN